MARYQMTMQTTSSEKTVEGVATPSPSKDGTSRLVWGCDDFGRGISVTVRPLEATGQFVCHRVELEGTTSKAGPQDA
jgi:hypothetical protein